MNRALIYLAIISALVAGAGWQGYRIGYDASDAAHNDATLAAIAEGKRLDAARLKAQTERDELSRKLEEAANEDPIIVSQCLSPDRVRRLNTLGQ